MAERCPKHSVYSYAVLHRRWRAEIGHIALAKIETEDLRPLLRELVKGGRAGATIWAYRTWIRTVLKDAVVDGLIPSNPADRFRRGEFPSRRPKRPKDYFDLREVQQLLDGTEGRDRVILAVGPLTGVRLAEILGLHVGDYVRAAKPLPMLRIAYSWREREGARGETKTDVVREMPVHPALAHILNDWIDRGWRDRYGRAPKPTDWLVPSDYAHGQRSGRLRPLRSGTVRQILYRALDRLGMRRRLQHDFCRTFVTALREAGAPRDLVKFLRHPRPSEVHDLYLIWPWSTLCEAVSRLNITLRNSSQLELFDPE